MKLIKVLRKSDASAIPEEIKKRLEFVDWLREQEFSKNEVAADFIYNSGPKDRIEVYVRLLGKTGGNRFTQNEFSSFTKTISEIEQWSKKVMATAKSKFPTVDFKWM